MQYYGLIDSLANFPVYWDASWERQLRLYSEGGVDGIEVIDCADEPGDPDCLDEGVDYVRFTSERFHRSYLAFTVETDSNGQRGEAYMFNMLMEAVELQDHLASSTLVSTILNTLTTRAAAMASSCPSPETERRHRTSCKVDGSIG